MDPVSQLGADLAELWPLLVVGICAFAIWGIGKSAAERSGYHLGVLGIAAVVAVLAIVSWWLHVWPLAVGLAFVTLVLILVGLFAPAR